MASRVYTLSGANLTVQNGSPTTLACINPGTTASLVILRCWVSQFGTTTSQQFGVELATKVTVFPTVVSATPAPIDTTDPASKIAGVAGACAAGKCGVNASAEGAGATTVVYPDSFNNLNGWLWIPTPAEQIYLPGGSASAFSVILLTTPTTLTGWNVGITFQEV